MTAMPNVEDIVFETAAMQSSTTSLPRGLTLSTIKKSQMQAENPFAGIINEIENNRHPKKQKMTFTDQHTSEELNVLSDQEGTDGSGSDRNTKRSKDKTSRKSKLDEISAKIDPNIIKQRQEVRTCHCVYVK